MGLSPSEEQAILSNLAQQRSRFAQERTIESVVEPLGENLTFIEGSVTTVRQFRLPNATTQLYVGVATDGGKMKLLASPEDREKIVEGKYLRCWVDSGRIKHYRVYRENPRAYAQ